MAAVSAHSAWAAGGTGSGKTVIERWNGSAWQRVASPSPGVRDVLSGVAAVSAARAWAVGSYQNSPSKTLILRWNGRA